MNNQDQRISIALSPAKAITALASSIIILVVALMLWKQQQFENNILIACNYYFEHDAYRHFFQFISRFGMGMISVSFAVLVFLSFREKQLAHLSNMFMYAIFSFALASIAGDLLKEIIGRARPVAALGELLAQTDLSGSASFPSGHATKSMGLALPFAIMTLNKGVITKVFKVVTLVLATLVCYSRIALQKHYLSDVLGGIALVLFFTVIAIWVVNLFYKRRNIDEFKLPQLNKRLALVFVGLAVLLAYI